MTWLKLHIKGGQDILVNLALASDILWDEDKKLTIICYPFHNPTLGGEETYHLNVTETLEEIMAMI